VLAQAAHPGAAVLLHAHHIMNDRVDSICHLSRKRGKFAAARADLDHARTLASSDWTTRPNDARFVTKFDAR
jgi:hypothetical protein